MKGFLLFLLIIAIVPAKGQKKFINRKVAQKHYDGFILMQDGKYNEAIGFFNKAIEEDPEAYFVYQNRALCRLFLQDTTGAISDYKMNIKLEPGNAESHYALGNIYKFRNDTILASELFAKSIALADTGFNKVKLAYMYQFLGNIEFNNNRFNTAIPHFEKITDYFPEKSNFYIKKAVAYYQLDSLQESCKNLELAYIYGESVTCGILTHLCSGCAELENQRIKKPDNEKGIDILLTPLLKDYSASKSSKQSNYPTFPQTLVKVFYNKNWDICMESNAEYYREAYWSKKLNFFAGSFTDHYINDSVLARGSYNLSKTHGDYDVYFPNGQTAITGKFSFGDPVGNWKYFYENGNVWIDIQFENNIFIFHFLKDNNGNDFLKEGSGPVNVAFNTADGKQLILSGQLVNYKKDGEWNLSIDNKPLIYELYKNTTFKKGVVYKDEEKIKIDQSYLTNWIFTPLYLGKTSTLQFENDETLFSYPFMVNSKNNIKI